MNKSYSFNNQPGSDANLAHLAAIFDKDEIQGQASHLLSNLGYALKKFKYLILFCTLLFTFLGWYITAKKPILYRSTLTLINEPDYQSGMMSTDSARYLVYLTSHYYQTQFEILASKKLARKVAERIVDEGISVPVEATTHLKKSPLYEWVNLADAKLHEIVAKISTKLRGAEINLEPPVIDTQSVDRVSRKTEQYTVLVQSGLQVSGGERSQLLTLTFVSTDRVFAAQILNLIAAVYQDFISESKAEVTQTTAQWLVNQMETAKLELLESEKTLIEYQKKVQLTDSDNYESQNIASYNELNSQFNAAKLDYEELLARYGARHPEVKQAYVEYNYLKKNLDSSVDSRFENNDALLELAKLEKEVETNREFYQNYLERFKGFNLSGDDNVSTVKVLDSAEVPSKPFAPNLERAILLWCCFGILFGVVFSLLLSFMDRTYKTVEDIEHKLRLPVLGQLPFLSNKILSALVSGKRQVADPEIYYTENTKSIFSEAVNHIRTNILFSNVDMQPQTILITSSIQAEGKTTVATNLAFSLAKIDKTILIDADLRKPRIADVFRSESGPESHESGLVDYLAGLSTFEQSSYQHTMISNLTILPSGTIPPNPQELLASKKFNQFLDELKPEFKYIVIDTAPVLPVSDSIILGKVVDAVLVAVKAGSTTIKMTKETIKRLNIANVNPTGLVLTQLDKPNKAYGKHGMNYYYSYYGKEVKKSA